MYPPIVDQVVIFYNALFNQVFVEPFRSQIGDLLKRKAMTRQIEEAADAASQSLTRFFLNEQLNEQQTAQILDGYGSLSALLTLADVSNPNVPPETLVKNLGDQLPCPSDVEPTKQATIYRAGLQAVVQVLTLVGPVVAEWQKLKFSTSFELLRRVTGRLNRITEQLDKVGSAGRQAADTRYELTYRDFLLQRFHRVEAGTVRVTTNMDVDLRELFVMPDVLPCQSEDTNMPIEANDVAGLMNLSAARELLASPLFPKADTKRVSKQQSGLTALEFVQRHDRSVLIGTPGSGKSTFLEWLQLRIATVDEDFVLGDGQAIPLLLRVRQLDMRTLPEGAELIAKATASQYHADLMPSGWIERQMRAGRVLFMLDGLDETDPELRETCLLPWLRVLCEKYPQCRFLISSRPAGYAWEVPQTLGFIEADIQDFDDARISEYANHWCTAIRLARNEPEEEARREGKEDGQSIVDSFKTQPYIRDLARNPLMLSAICLVNYFEGGQLPSDRAMLYRLCVEGLLHHWDQRRGIRSEYGLDEKLRVCREVAIAMQADDRAEYEADKVQAVFAAVLQDEDRAAKLLEHIRYRAGLLIERRPGIFAFAHLTFQEYLAARAVHEGNRLNIGAEQLVNEYDDGRWNEVIALYCGIAPASTARQMIVSLIAQPNVKPLSNVLTEAYLSGCPELRQDVETRLKVIKKVAVAPFDSFQPLLSRFAPKEVAPIANALVGKCESDIRASEAHSWLHKNHKYLNKSQLVLRLSNWQELEPREAGELIHLVHSRCSDSVLMQMYSLPGLYEALGPTFGGKKVYPSQAEVAWEGLSSRSFKKSAKSEIINKIVLRILQNIMLNLQIEGQQALPFSIQILDKYLLVHIPDDVQMLSEFATLARDFARIVKQKNSKMNSTTNAPRRVQDQRHLILVKALNAWASKLEAAISNTEMSRDTGGIKLELK